MIYDYNCVKCQKNFEIIKSMHDAARGENCPQCSEPGKRLWSAPEISGTKIFEAEYYHSLGKVIHNKRELRNELDRRNLQPVGNDFGSGDKMQKHFDDSRQQKWKDSWDKVGP